MNKPATESNPCVFMVFDILFLNGRYLFNEPLIERKKILNEVISDSDFIKKVSYIENEGEQFYSQIEAFKLEVMIAKAKNSRYYPWKRTEWLKIVRYETYEVLLTGYTKASFGLLCSFVTPDGLKPAGIGAFVMHLICVGRY